SKEGDPRGSLFAATPTEDGLWDLERLQVAGAEGGAVEGYLIAIARDADGELFALTSAGELGGAVNRITATEATGAVTTPDGTNATGSATSALGTDTADTDANATAGVRSAAGNGTASGSGGMNGSDGTNGSGNASGTETSGDGAG